MKKSQVDRVFAVMSKGLWVTPRTLARRTQLPLGAGLYARIRDLRKFEYGGYIIEARPVDDTGDWEYRLATDSRGRLKKRRRPKASAADAYKHYTRKELIAEILNLKLGNGK